MVYELRVVLNSGSCREVMQKGLIKGICLSSLRCSLSSAAAGRLIRAACSRDSVGACKGQVISIPGRAKVRPVGMPLIRLAWLKPNQATTKGAPFYLENKKGYKSRIGSRVCGPKKLLFTFGYKSKMKIFFFAY